MVKETSDLSSNKRGNISLNTKTSWTESHENPVWLTRMERNYRVGRGLQASINLLALWRRLGAFIVGNSGKILIDSGPPISAVLAVASDTARLAGLVHNRESRRRARTRRIGRIPHRRQSSGMCHRYIFRGLFFGCVHGPLDRRRSRSSLFPLSRRPRGGFGLPSSLGLLLRHGDPLHEVDKPVSVALWRDGRNLGTIIRKALEEILDSFDRSVL